MSVIMSIFIGSYGGVLGVIAGLAYVAVGVLVPVMISKKSGSLGEEFRAQSGQLSGYVLESLRGLDEEIQYSCGEKRLDDLKLRTDSLSMKQERMSLNVGFNSAVTNSVILIFDIIMLAAAVGLYRNGSVGIDEL